MKNKFFNIIYILTIVLFLLLPFYLFNSGVFIGGDDSRLLYIFPWKWITHIAYYSWFHFGAVGTNNPNQALLPFLSVWSLLNVIIQSKVVLDYLSISFPLILGFIYFQKFIGELVEDKKNDYRFVFYIGALIYTLSPIIQTNQLSIFLYSAWLIGLLPIITYYFLKYSKTGDFIYVFINTLWCMVLSFSISTIPWFLGYFFPISISLLIITSLFTKKTITIFIKRSVIFFGLLFISQAFWTYSFISNILFAERNSFLGNVLSKQLSDTFSGTVLSTASGNILYPLLNLFHRQITMDYNSPLKPVFLFFYDKTIIVDLVFPVVLFLGILNFRKYFEKVEKGYYIYFLLAFAFSLFLFTVNIGPLENIFLFMGHIPGFVMFRNFYDKFALGYTLLYAIILTLSMVVVIRKYDRLKIVLPLVVLLIVLINLIPIKAVINKPIWTTKNIYTNITIPKEYTQFMQQVENNVPQTANILSLPFNIAGYTMIKDQNSNNIFAGRSPVQLFTGINDFSGNLSFTPSQTNRFVNDITKRKYKELNTFLVQHNIGYVFVTNNIPKQILHSYLFDKTVLSFQDKKMLQAITGKKILVSSKGNYILYRTKYPTSLFQSNNLSYKKINPVMYQLAFNNIKHPQQFSFIDSFSSGWKLYPEKYRNSALQNNELSFLFRQNIYENSHTILNKYANQWTINPFELKKNFSPAYYHVNPDGSIDMKLVLYFEPQENFYIGVTISIITVLGSLGYLLYSRRRKNS